MATPPVSDSVSIRNMIRSFEESLSGRLKSSSKDVVYLGFVFSSKVVRSQNTDSLSNGNLELRVDVTSLVDRFDTANLPDYTKRFKDWEIFLGRESSISDFDKIKTLVSYDRAEKSDNGLVSVYYTLHDGFFKPSKDRLQRKAYLNLIISPLRDWVNQHHPDRRV